MADAEERHDQGGSSAVNERDKREGEPATQASRARGTEATRRLPEASNELLSAAQAVRELEHLKRKTPIASPAFHVLADRIQVAARRVFELASQEERIGNDVPPDDRSIDDVDADTRTVGPRTNGGVSGSELPASDAREPERRS